MISQYSSDSTENKFSQNSLLNFALLKHAFKSVCSEKSSISDIKIRIYLNHFAKFAFLHVTKNVQ